MKYLLILLVLISNTAFACDSYEDCMDRVHKFETSDYAKKVPYIPGNFSWECRDHYKLEAIAYKLDEISKKLDKQEFSKEEIEALHEAYLLQRAAHHS